jgi:putative endonuclease
MQSWFVYILRCDDDSLYTGITTDVQRRFTEHKNGEGSAYTKSFGAKEIVYTQEVGDKSTALVREHEIKQLSQEEKKELVADEGCG